jgi:hypothetical protein
MSYHYIYTFPIYQHFLVLSPHMTFIYLHFPYLSLLKSCPHVDTHFVPIPFAHGHVPHVAVGMIPLEVVLFSISISFLHSLLLHGTASEFCVWSYSVIFILYSVFFFCTRRTGH